MWQNAITFGSLKCSFKNKTLACLNRRAKQLAVVAAATRRNWGAPSDGEPGTVHLHACHMLAVQDRDPLFDVVRIQPVDPEWRQDIRGQGNV